MAETALNFGPDWLRVLAHGSAQPSQQPSASAVTAPKYRLAEFRYGREEMLALMPRDSTVPEYLKDFPHLTRDQFQIPLALTPVTEEEQRIWARSVNSDAVLRQSGKGAPGNGMGRTGRGGGSADRGRGRGRGSYYQRGLTYEDSDDGSSTSFSRPKQIERSHSVNEKDQRWDDRDRRFDRTFSGRSGDDSAPAKDVPRNENWRKFEKDDDDDWRSSNVRSTDKIGGRGSWRNNADKDRRDGSEKNHSNRGASGGNRASSHQKGIGSHAWKEDIHGNQLPEWSVEENDEPDIVGTFDSSGAFLETKVNENSLDEIYASDDADEGIAKSSPEAKSVHSKKTPPKSSSTSSAKQKTKTKAVGKSEETVLEETRVPQNSSETCKNVHKLKTIHPVVDNVIKQCVVPERSHSVDKKTDYTSVNLPNVPDVVKSTKEHNVVLTNSRASEASAPLTMEEDAFAYHKKATENMVAQWTEEEEQRVISQTTDPQLQNQEKDNKWYYQDPQGEIQGPFTSTEMLEWYSAGYFTMNLMVRRNCDKKFSQLGELIKTWGHVPFMPGSIPPPTQATTPMTTSLPTPITQTIVPPSPVVLPVPAQLPKQDDQLLALQQQILQQHMMQQQIMLRQAQLQQLLSQVSQQDNFSNLSQQQQQVMLQQFMAQHQIPRPNVGPISEQAGLETMTPLPLHLLGLAPMPSLMKNDLSLWNLAPKAAGTWPVNASTTQPPSSSIWDVNVQKPSSEDSEVGKQKMLIEEQEKARKAEEERRLQEMELEEKRKLEELRRKQEEEKLLKELQKQEEERKRIEELKKEEEKRLEEQQKLEEQRLLEEQRRKEEELKRQEELKRIEEQKRLEEIKRQEEQKCLEELKRKEEERRKLEELRKQELQKLEEKRQKEELQRKILEKERELQLELERQKEAQRQKEMEEKLQKEREEMELRRLAELKKSQGPAWGIQTTQSSLELSLADIQRLQEEKERQEKEEKMRLQLLQQQTVKQVQQNKNGLTWAKRSADTVPAVKSLIEIQQEETDRLAHLQRSQKPQAPAPVVSANVGVWGNSSHLNKITAPPQTWNSVPSSGFWDDALSSTQSRKQPAKSNDSAFPALAVPSKPAAPVSSKSKIVRAKKEEDVVTKLYGTHCKPTDEFTKWCNDTLKIFQSSVDVPTFVAFLKDIESPYEVYDYVKSYLGDSKETNAFAKQFLERRSKYRNQSKQSEENTLWGPAPAITPSVNKPITQTSIDSDVNSSTKGKTKKRKNKMQKLDSSMLGFTVQSNPDRLNVGEIDHVDGM